MAFKKYKTFISAKASRNRLLDKKPMEHQMSANPADGEKKFVPAANLAE